MTSNDDPRRLADAATPTGVLRFEANLTPADVRQIRSLYARIAALEGALLNARIVAEYWRDEFMGGDLYSPLRACSHPLACVIGALDGETEPRQMGIPENEYERRRAVLAQTEQAAVIRDDALYDAIVESEQREPRDLPRLRATLEQAAEAADREAAEPVTSRDEGASSHPPAAAEPRTAAGRNFLSWWMDREYVTVTLDYARVSVQLIEALAAALEAFYGPVEAREDTAGLAAAYAAAKDSPSSPDGLDGEAGG